MSTRTMQSVESRVALFEQRWPELSEAVGHAFRMEPAEREWLRAKPVARLVAALPFIAGCKQPERTAAAHLGTYLLSIREAKPYFNATEEDDADIMDRLRLGMSFNGGDQAIIDKGMALLALNMVDDYERDVQIDAAMGKYNPVASGAFDAERVRTELRSRINAVEIPGLSTVLGKGEDIMGTWGV